MSKFVYHSEQTHSTMENGEATTKKNIVNIENGKGTKTVVMMKNGAEKRSTKRLSKAEMKKIKANQFIPQLFKPCYDCLRPTTGSRRRTQKKKGTR